MNAQALQMKAFVGDLMSLIKGGNGTMKAVASGGMGYEEPCRRATTFVQTPHAEAPRSAVSVRRLKEPPKSSAATPKLADASRKKLAAPDESFEDF